MRDRFTPEQAELLPIGANEIQLALEGPAPAARQITMRRSTLHIVPDPDHLAELEATDGRRLERMADHDRGKPANHRSRVRRHNNAQLCRAIGSGCPPVRLMR